MLSVTLEAINHHANLEEGGERKHRHETGCYNFVVYSGALTGLPDIQVVDSGSIYSQVHLYRTIREGMMLFGRTS
jgi:hypothetical protein